MTATLWPWDRCEEKIRPEHRDRAAVVHVRQSSRQQVAEHAESARLQYALAGRAVALGWARSQVMVIDDDLGVSAAVAGARAGFQKLVTEVTMGRVGVVLGSEMSRLARTGRDWHHEITVVGGVITPKPMNSLATITESKYAAAVPVVDVYADAQARHADPQRDAEDRLLEAASWPPQSWPRDLRLDLIRGAAEAKARRELKGDPERAREQARWAADNAYSNGLRASMARGHDRAGCGCQRCRWDIPGCVYG